MSKTVRVDLPEEGNSFYVEIRDPMFLRWKEQRLLQQADGEESINYSTRLLKFLVVGGNVTGDNGQQLNYPMEDNDVDELTNYAISQIMNKFKERVEEVQPTKN